MEIEYLLEKAHHYPHIFKLVPVEYQKPKTGTWAEYKIDGVVKFIINSTHPESIDFFQQQLKLNKEREIMNKDLQTSTGGAMVSTGQTVEQSRAVAETQAAMLVAKKFPRDENMACQKITNACQRVGLAESGMYAYKRGTSLITGVSIRLAEVMAKYWGNITYGFRETGRTEMTSEVEVYCWDMENNVRATRAFTVKHWRDTQSGGYQLKSERDIYELIANNAQRRVRACILEMIPGDIVEEAEKQCQATLEQNQGKSIEETVSDMLNAFKEFKVNQAHLEAFLNHKLTAIVPAEVVKLKQVYKSIKDGIAPATDFFNFDGENATTPDANDSEEQEKKPVEDTKKSEETTIQKAEKVIEKEIQQAIIMKETSPDEFSQACESLGFENDPEKLTVIQCISIGAALNSIIDLGNQE